MSANLPAQRFKYIVSDPWGTMVDRLSEGTVMIDMDHGRQHDYTIMNANTYEIVGGWHAEFIGEVTDPETLAKLT